MNNPKYKVSVILPNYNHSKYLNQRIDSILNQTYKDFELIILDDKSPDNSAEVIESYRGHEKITHIVINEQNSGSTFKQWDKGLKLASGEYIWIAESDDYADSTFLKKCIAALESNPEAVLCYTDSNFVDENGEKTDCWIDQLTIPENQETLENGTARHLGIDFVRDYMLYFNYIFNASMVLFRHEALNNIPTDFYRFFRGAGDHIFWTEMIIGDELIHIPERLNYFRQHNNKVSNAMQRDNDHNLELSLIHIYLTIIYGKHAKSVHHDNQEQIELTKAERIKYARRILGRFIRHSGVNSFKTKSSEATKRYMFGLITSIRIPNRKLIKLFGVIPLYKIKYQSQNEKHYILGVIERKRHK